MHNMFEPCPCAAHDNANTAHVPQMPLIGDAAPEFVANTTNGTVNFPADYAGRWVILFSHPADFTPVCTSEFMTFQSMIDEFRALNTDIIGLSVGTLTGHLAWIRAIRELEYRDWRNMSITFPIIDDMNMDVAHKYGMIHHNAADGKTVRAVFIIDPKGIIRAILYYPLTTGRNFSEIQRLLVALQTTDAFHVSTPADWTPGEDVIVPAPTTTAEMDARMSKQNKSLDVRAWFFAFKKLAADTIMSKLTQCPSSRRKKD